MHGGTRPAEDLAGRGLGVLNLDGEVGMELAGRRAQVTGTNRGLGDQFVEALLARGGLFVFMPVPETSMRSRPSWHGTVSA